jgi:hypothetical protein
MMESLLLFFLLHAMLYALSACAADVDVISFLSRYKGAHGPQPESTLIPPVLRCTGSLLLPVLAADHSVRLFALHNSCSTWISSFHPHRLRTCG